MRPGIFMLEHFSLNVNDEKETLLKNFAHVTYSRQVAFIYEEDLDDLCKRVFHTP